MEVEPEGRGWDSRTPRPGGVRLRARWAGLGGGDRRAALKAAPGAAPRPVQQCAGAEGSLVSRRRVRVACSVAAAAGLRHHERLQQRGARRALLPRVPSLLQ